MSSYQSVDSPSSNTTNNYKMNERNATSVTFQSHNVTVNNKQSTELILTNHNIQFKSNTTNNTYTIDDILCCNQLNDNTLIIHIYPYSTATCCSSSQRYHISYNLKFQYQ